MLSLVMNYVPKQIENFRLYIKGVNRELLNDEGFTT